MLRPRNEVIQIRPIPSRGRRRPFLLLKRQIHRPLHPVFLYLPTSASRKRPPIILITTKLIFYAGLLAGGEMGVPFLKKDVALAVPKGPRPNKTGAPLTFLFLLVPLLRLLAVAAVPVLLEAACNAVRVSAKAVRLGDKRRPTVAVEKQKQRRLLVRPLGLVPRPRLRRRP